MTEFDRRSLEHLLPAAPGTPDWDDVMSRSAAQKTRRSRFVVVALAALVLVVVTASAFAVRAALDSDRPGLPPAGAAPSRPASGKYVLWFVGRPEPSGSSSRPRFTPVHDVRIYADGRVIWRREGGPYTVAGVRTGFLEQRLTTEGVERLRSTVLSSGLFDRDRDVTSPNLTWFGAITARTDGRLVRVGWWGGRLPNPQPPRTVATKTQALAISRLSRLLAQPKSGLPASAWKDQKLRAYVPARYAICYWGGPNTYQRILRPSLVIGSVPRAVRDLLRGKTTTYRSSAPLGLNNPTRSLACSELTTDQARALEEILATEGFERKPRGFVWEVPTASDARSELREISFEPILPHGQWIGPLGG